ncbi:MAG TPA: uracil phosphoribosyltransferase [Anaerolineae bacterium]|nr:uracil phosphoribosyltransferase [Anaerolineae bacterium]HOQ99704.1 uracil phosphoribosyltransferase [Anaerolineae bacterium]HPL26623.1 uracil phosphoribosyltransferase [Anaerolineae bacterium]
MGRVHVSQHPLIQHKLALLRSIETGPKKFRELVREISILLAYEATADLALTPIDVMTPLTNATGMALSDKIGLIPILRAGLGMVEGIWEMMPAAEVWHIGLYRDHRTLQPVAYYNKLPVNPTVQVCLILDPMLATGGSAVAAADMLKQWGARRIKYLGIIAAPEGVEFLQAHHPDIDIHLGTIDDHLTPEPSAPGEPPRGYIVPGLGDAGDRQFGTG